jgi:hypothetical protein
MIGGGIPRSIFVLSMVSMALTSASCVFNTLLPIYMVTELKMTMRTMGMFEGEGCRASLWGLGCSGWAEDQWVPVSHAHVCFWGRQQRQDNIRVCG